MQVVRRLGAGGFAVVDEVLMPDGVRLAKKTLEPQNNILQFVSMEQLRDRFSREVRYQCGIQHPNVVRILYGELEADPPYCLMELAETTLADELRVDRTLGGNPQAALFDVLSGLQVLEEAGFTHRDLKPQNVLKIRNSDGTARYAISDFGLVTAGAANSTTLTGTGVNGGTPYYAAPELNQDFKRATTAADIYAVGAILHDIFDGGTRVPYSELDGPGPVGEVIRRCTRKNPVRRFANVAELREALYAALSSGDVVFKSVAEEKAVSLLQDQSSLTDDDWDYVYFVIGENDAKGIPNKNVYRYLSLAHIQELSASAPQLLKAIGMGYAQHSMGTFDFDYCDVLASRLEKLFDHGDTELKANVLLALLQLGTSHNRWYVERVFARLAGAGCDQPVVQRFLTETSVQGYDLNRALKHIKWSIGADRNQLHPLIAQIPE
jgi:eukaryotic-like serine/threonine-protein kinase